MVDSQHREPAPERYPNNPDAIKLYLLDMAMSHLSRNQGLLGLAANAMQRELHAEKDEVVARLVKALGKTFEDKAA